MNLLFLEGKGEYDGVFWRFGVDMICSTKNLEQRDVLLSLCFSKGSLVHLLWLLKPAGNQSAWAESVKQLWGFEVL